MSGAPATASGVVGAVEKASGAVADVAVPCAPAVASIAGAVEGTSGWVVVGWWLVVVDGQ